MVQAHQAHRDALTEEQWGSLRAPVKMETAGARSTAGVEPVGPGRIAGRAFLMVQTCRAASEARRLPPSARRVGSKGVDKVVPNSTRWPIPTFSRHCSRLGRAAAAPELKKEAEELLAPQL